MNLENKTALITGGSRGIGRAIALELARSGVNVGISYVSNEDKANEVVKAIKEHGVKALAVKGNVSLEEDVSNMVKTIEKELGAIDILVNNAGVTKDNLLIRMKTQEWDEVMDVNLKGTFLCTKAV